MLLALEKCGNCGKPTFALICAVCTLTRMTDLFRRFISLSDIKVREDGTPDSDSFELTASTNAPVRMGDWSEVLEHKPDSADTKSARSLLLNHKADQIVGSISGISFDGTKCVATARCMRDARLATGVRVIDAVKSGALSGVSIGYTYSRDDADWDDQKRTLTVRKWSMREASLTPIPADMDAQVRSLPDWIESNSKESPMTESVKPPAAPVDVDAVRTAANADGKRIAETAESLGLRASDYIGKTADEAQSAMLRAVVEQRKAALPEPTQTATPSVEIMCDRADKVRDAVIETWSHRVFDESGHKVKLNGLQARSYTDQAIAYANAMGIRTQKWTKRDAAWFWLGRTENIETFHRDSANISVGSFPNFVTLNAITKIIAKGFEMIPSYVKYQEISTGQVVPDFKTYHIGGLGTGNLIQTAEGLAFPELAKAEGYYSDTAKMWGGTLSLSIQALVNDDTNSFDRSLRMAGAGAQKTIDQRVFQKLLQGTSATSGTSTWTSNTSSGASIVTTTADSAAGARGRLGIPRAALMQKVGLDGNPLGTIPTMLLCGPTNEQNALGLLLPAGGQVVATSPALATMRVITSPWLESSLTGNSSTTYYLGADANETTGLVVSRVAGFENPTVMEYDAGALAARKWKTFLPFEADLFYFTNAAGTVVIPGWQQATT